MKKAPISDFCPGGYLCIGDHPNFVSGSEFYDNTIENRSGGVALTPVDVICWNVYSRIIDLISNGTQQIPPEEPSRQASAA